MAPRPLGDEIAELNAQWAQAFNRGDPAGVTALYAENARLLTPTSVVASGPDEIRAYWASVIEHGVSGHRFETIESGQDGDTAWQAAGWRAETGTAERAGNAMLLYRREGGAWRIRMHIWN